MCNMQCHCSDVYYYVLTHALPRWHFVTGQHFQVQTRLNVLSFACFTNGQKYNLRKAFKILFQAQIICRANVFFREKTLLKQKIDFFRQTKTAEKWAFYIQMIARDLCLHKLEHFHTFVLANYFSFIITDIFSIRSRAKPTKASGIQETGLLYCKAKKNKNMWLLTSAMCILTDLVPGAVHPWFV